MTVNNSNTFNFNPSAGELILNAFGRIGVRPAEITASHMYQARLSANFVLTEWANSTPMLWEVGLQTLPLLQGSATYTVPAETVMILDVVVEYGTPATDRIITPISRTEYMSYPNKDQQGFPTVFWFDRLVSPTITVWPVPDGAYSYILKYYSVRQTMDVAVPNGQTVEVPFRFLDAFVAALSWRLSELYAPQMEQRLEYKAQRAFDIAINQDKENVPLMIYPGLGSYYN